MDDAGEQAALVMGAGGLGAAAALTLATTGLARLVLADGAALEPTDLPVLPLLGEADLGQPRAAILARALALHAPSMRVEVVTTPLDPAAALALARGAGVVVDAQDRFAAMFLAGDAAAAAGVPLVHGGLLHHTAQLLSVLPGRTGCLRCLFEAPPPAAETPPLEPGVLGPLAGLAGALLGAEAARLLAGHPGAYAGQLVSWEARSGWSRAVPVHRRPGCTACGHQPIPSPASSPAAREEAP